MKKIVILGGGGHARVLIDLIIGSTLYEIAGILDSRLEIGSHISEIPVLGGDELLGELYNRGINNTCIGMGSIKDNSKRKMLYEKVKKLNFTVPHLIHPGAIISQKATIAEGIQVMAGAIIQTDAHINQNTIINTGAILEHDCTVGEHVHICPGAVISGGCTIDDGVFVGAGATVIQGIKIGVNSVVAAGAVVVRDVPANSKVMGIPAR